MGFAAEPVQALAVTVNESCEPFNATEHIPAVAAGSARIVNDAPAWISPSLEDRHTDVTVGVTASH